MTPVSCAAFECFGGSGLMSVVAMTRQIVMARTSFALQPGEGYFSRDRLFLIEKSCAGINFMIAAFGMLIFALLHRVGSRFSAARVLSVSLLASYSAAVLVNAVRIAIAMWLGAHPSALSAFSAGDVHRVEGITVYFGGLVLLYELVQRLDRGVVLAGRDLGAEARRVEAAPWRTRNTCRSSCDDG